MRGANFQFPEFEEVIKKYMKGFEATTDDRMDIIERVSSRSYPSLTWKASILRLKEVSFMFSRFGEGLGAFIPAWWLMGSARRSALVMKFTCRGGIGILTTGRSPSEHVREDENLDKTEMCYECCLN